MILCQLKTFVGALIAATFQAKLVVYGPEALLDMFPSEEKTIDANYANFGHIPYGQSLVSNLNLTS